MKLSIQVYPEDMRDLEAVASAWEVPLSLLGWALVHEWLQRGRGLPLSLGDARGPLRWALEKALEDAELGPWLRGEIARACSVAPEG